MAKSEGIIVRRVRRQHGSFLIVIPIEVRQALGLKTGDYIVFNKHKKTGVVELTKFTMEVKKDGRSKRCAGRGRKG